MLKLVIVDSAAWASLSLVVGYGAHRLPDRWLQRDTALTRLRAFERDGALWETRTHIRKWKGRLPEAGAFFGGPSKRHLNGDLRRMVIETRRAELVHWALIAGGPIFSLWNPPPMALIMMAFAIVANGPCLVVQRFNRARCLRVLGRRAEVSYA